ncbi:sensor histidine kinase [Microbacterium sp. ASV49]|uniref:Signal transduction histidine-protein kinase/phosphatase MprB n=1 Tax=Microbacterium candidum TaxID=3041922 RepID=A0ABT7MV33_9MICO|nr:HAMP domain-containing sensor histidine kinase [Microbacterium sp. ASV49]MDL9978310.1 HAMP domain-containing sensor histidine kinase [Microbacterium sp. ASV49]
MAAAIGVLIVVGAVSVLLYFIYAASLQSQVDASLVDVAQQATSIERQIKQSISDKGPTPDIGKTITVGTVEIQLLPGPVWAGHPARFGALDSRDVAVANRASPAYFSDARDGGDRFRVYTAAMPDASVGALVRTGRAANADDAALLNAAVLLGALTVAAAAFTYLVGRLSAGRILRPISRLTEAAEHVTATHDLSARIGVTGTDEVGRLGASFDAMLAELQNSVTAQRQLVADASHELRTPLTSLTTNLDLLDEGAGLADLQAPGLVRAAREQAGELRTLIDDLLDLARYEEKQPHRTAARLDLITADTVRRVRHRMPHALINTRLEESLVTVDPDALDHAIANLIENAIAWSPSGEPVDVTVSGRQVSVTDHGPGIHPDDLPHIFERFYRASTARSRPGSGLGLAIVGTVVRANDGDIQVTTSSEGSTFTIALPVAPTP